MRNLFLAFILIVFVNSCKGPLEETIVESLYPQKWELVKMTGSLINSETTGEDMEWQEFYILMKNNTFTKTREFKGTTSTITGTFEWINNADRTATLVLTYPSYNELIGTCSLEAKENLHTNDEDMLVSEWMNCDGPGLYYAFAGYGKTN